MPAGSMAVTFASCPGLLVIFTDTALGGAGGVVVTGVVDVDVPVDVEVLPAPVVVPPLVLLPLVVLVALVVDPVLPDVFVFPPPLALVPALDPPPCVVVEPPPRALVDPPTRVELPPEPTCVWPPPRAPFGPCAAAGVVRPMTVTATTHPSRFMVRNLQPRTRSKNAAARCELRKACQVRRLAVRVRPFRTRDVSQNGIRPFRIDRRVSR